MDARSGERGPFPLLRRVFAGACFALMATVYARGLPDTLRGLLSAHAGLTDWAPTLTRICTLVVFTILGWLMLTRPPFQARRRGILPVAAAFLGTYAVWILPFFPLARSSWALQTLSAVLALGGSLMIIVAVVRLGGSFSIAPQARRLVTDGPYRLVRHPLYLAEEIAIVGVLLQYAWYAAVLFLAVHLALQMRRILYEEALLSAVFPDYEAYARRTARLIPGIW